MYKLVIQDDEGKTTVVPLIRDEITIGRKEGNTIRLTERNVSRKHARIVRANGAVAIEDLGSYNGVRVNGTRISQRTALTVSDRVQIGDYLIELKAEGAEQAVPPASYEDAKTQPVERVDPNYGRGPTQPLPGMPPPLGGMSPGLMTTGMGGPSGVMIGNPEQTLVALSDTDPRIPRAPVVAVAPSSHASMHARLVILSSNFAGREFDLSKPQMVIGRTDDNDVVINHRSISRNHAKVVRENETGRYTISDLQSSNGVRVNGEEYGKVELRRGDIIDLGHVRMRFVDIGEDFLFGRDAQIVDVPTKGGKGLWIGLIALLLVGGAVGIYVATRGSGSTEDGTTTASNDGTGSSSATGSAGKASGTSVPAVAPDAQQTVASVKPPDAGAAASSSGSASGAVAVDAAVADNGKQLGDLRAAVQKAIDAEHWVDVVTTCKQVITLAPDDADCKAKIDQAKMEEGAALKFGDFRDAVSRKDYPKVASTFREIGDSSIYKERARPTHDKMRDDYVGLMKGKAEGLAKAGKCKDLAKLATEAGRAWKEAEDAVKAVSCTTTVAVKDDHTHTNPDHTNPDHTNPDHTNPDNNTPPPTGQSLDELVAAANAAARDGQYGKALKSAQEALKLDSGNQQALTAAAIAACNLKSADLAKKYIAKLASSRQQMARQICLRNNVTID